MNPLACTLNLRQRRPLAVPCPQAMATPSMSGITRFIGLLRSNAVSKNSPLRLNLRAALQQCCFGNTHCSSSILAGCLAASRFIVFAGCFAADQFFETAYHSTSMLFNNNTVCGYHNSKSEFAGCFAATLWFNDHRLQRNICHAALAAALFVTCLPLRLDICRLLSSNAV